MDFRADVFVEAATVLRLSWISGFARHCRGARLGKRPQKHNKPAVSYKKLSGKRRSARGKTERATPATPSPGEGFRPCSKTPRKKPEPPPGPSSRWRRWQR